MQYKIIVDKQPSSNPSAERKEYTIDIEELRVKGDVYDSLNIDKDKTYVTRRLSLSEYGVLSVLDEPVIEELTDVDIKLFEGDNYIYLMDMQGNNFYAEYLIKNDFNDIYATKNEMNSAITQTAQSIELSVNQKLEGYSTTEEMNAAIEVTANEINSEVSKKVGDDEIISKINQSAEGIQINANKVSLEGKEINLTGDDIAIESQKLSIDKDGKITIKTQGDSSPNYFVIEVDGEEQFFISSQSLQFIGEIGDTGINATELFAGDTLEEYAIMNRYGLTVGDQSSQSRIKSTEIRSPKLTQTSLESIKKNISKFTRNAIDIINSSDVYEYNLKSDEDTDKKLIGFIIGDGYRTPEEVISKDGQSVELYSTIGILCKAVQELSTRVKQLEQEVQHE